MTPRLTVVLRSRGVRFLTPPVLSQKGGPITAGFQLSISAPAGTILYTLNGPDPRGADGLPAPEAQVYNGPITLNANTRVQARAQVGKAYSGVSQGIYVVSVPPLVTTEITPSSMEAKQISF